MSSEYIIVNSSQQIFFVRGDKRFFDWINEVGRSVRAKVGYVFLAKFPTPNGDTSIDVEYGRFCPFGNEKSWPHNALLVLKDGTIYVPEKVKIMKEVEEYGLLPNTDATSDPTISLIKAVKKAAKKAPVRRSRK